MIVEIKTLNFQFKVSLLFSFLLVGFSVKAQECSINKQQFAEKSVGSLPSWIAVNSAYKKFGACDDGSIGEGFSESITYLLSDHWENLKPLILLIKKDKGFEKFFYAHIDSSVPIERLRKIQKHSEDKCPNLQNNLCKKISASTRKAISTAN